MKRELLLQIVAQIWPTCSTEWWRSSSLLFARTEPQAGREPNKPELAQIWAALHFYFSGLDPASSGLFGSLLADTWHQVCSDLANSSESPRCHRSPRCVGRINASYTILIKPPQPAVKNSYKQHFNFSSLSDSRVDSVRRGRITWKTSETSSCVAMKRWTDFNPEDDVCWL